MLARFYRLNRDNSGYVDWEELRTFRTQCQRYCTTWTDDNEEGCGYSSDPSETYVFKDGSSLYLMNPRQNAFSAEGY